MKLVGEKGTLLGDHQPYLIIHNGSRNSQSFDRAERREMFCKTRADLTDGFGPGEKEKQGKKMHS